MHLTAREAKELGIIPETYSRKSPPPEGELRALYFDQNKSTNGIAAHYGVSKGMVYNWFKDLGIKTRTNSEGVSIAQTGRPHSEAHAKAISDGSKGKVCNHMVGKRNPIFKSSSSGMHYSKGGRRDDLEGRYFRSAWEANYCRYLNWLIAQGVVARWEYEVDTFEFPVKRGTRSYTPDFKVWRPDGTFEYHEVKGFMDSKSLTKLRRMAKHYPQHTIELIDAKRYRSLAKVLSKIIPHWERGRAPADDSDRGKVMSVDDGIFKMFEKNLGVVEYVSLNQGS